MTGAAIAAAPLPKMAPEVKDKWLAALRSGDYAQGKNALATRTGFCCLGVLCEVAAADEVVQRRHNLDSPTEYQAYGYRMPGLDDYWMDVMPSPGLLEWAGLPVGVADILALMNDAEGKSFAEIADYIEENL